MADTRTYEGSCHCGAVRFRFESEAITTGLRCNCSICVRKGGVVSSRYYPSESFAEVVGADRLAVYRFGDEDMNHYFCPTCGVSPFQVVAKLPPSYEGAAKVGDRRINLGCVPDVDVFALEVRLVDGKSM